MKASTLYSVIEISHLLSWIHGNLRNKLLIANDEIIKKIARMFVVEKRVFDTFQIQKLLYFILFLLALLED
jgi:hypothetical protein